MSDNFGKPKSWKLVDIYVTEIKLLDRSTFTSPILIIVLFHFSGEPKNKKATKS